MVTRHNCKRDCIADFCRQVTLANKWSVYFMLGSSETSIRYACFKKYCTIPNMYDAVVCRSTFPSESYQDAIEPLQNVEILILLNNVLSVFQYHCKSNVGEILAAQIGLYWDIVCDTQPTKQ